MYMYIIKHIRSYVLKLYKDVHCKRHFTKNKFKNNNEVDTFIYTDEDVHSSSLNRYSTFY